MSIENIPTLPHAEKSFNDILKKVIFMTERYFYDFLLKAQSIAKIGLKFSTDPYALANYKDLETMSMDMLEHFSEISFERPNYFARDIYPTPNISVRTCIFSSDRKKVLLVKEASDGLYSLPGGWCDLYESPKQAAIKECLQEAGARVEITRLAALINRTPFKNPTSVPEYALVFEATLIGELSDHEYETTEVGFFDLEQLPPFSRKVTTPEMLRVIRAAALKETIID